MIFPHNQMQILPYNRVLKDLNGRTPEQMLAELRKSFTVTASDQSVRPASAHEYGMYLAGRWYRLNARPDLIPSDPIGHLPITVLSRCLQFNLKRLSVALIRDNLAQIAPVFLKQKYMLGDEFSMLDVAIAPLLWRLDYYDIQLPKQAAPLMKYAERLFSRPAFIDSLTASEKVMRK